MKKRWIVSGRVQGVGYRYYTRKKAVDLGLTGIVRNLDDGRVEVIASGDPDRLQQLYDALLEGPRFAIVSDICEKPIPPDSSSLLSDFRILT